MKRDVVISETSIKISLLGDLMPADTVYFLDRGTGSRIAQIVDGYTESENISLKDSNLVFCNLEAPLLLKNKFSGQVFEGNPAVVQLFEILNITVVSIANNHILDHGSNGLDQTIRCLVENGIKHVGLLINNIPFVQWFIIKGKKIAIAAFNAIHDQPDSNLIAPLENAFLYSTLEAIKKQSPDYVIFSLHWGNEYVLYPSPEQVEIARKLIENGVNIIVGHHPHVVQPVERYKGGIIIYSLGNFLFDMFWSEKVRNGMQVDLILHEDKTIDYQIKPFRIRSDFIQDYESKEGTLSLLSKGSMAFEMLKSRPREEYQKAYLKECKKSRFNARVRMKFYLFTHFFSLSSKAKTMLLHNLRVKLISFWKRN